VDKTIRSRNVGSEGKTDCGTAQNRQVNGTAESVRGRGRPGGQKKWFQVIRFAASLPAVMNGTGLGKQDVGTAVCLLPEAAFRRSRINAPNSACSFHPAQSWHPVTAFRSLATAVPSRNHHSEVNVPGLLLQCPAGFAIKLVDPLLPRSPRFRFRGRAASTLGPVS
jgi:hypothetical protein